MEFKVANFSQNVTKNKVDFDLDTYEYLEYNGHFCIKYFKTANTKTKAVQSNDGSMDSADSFITKHDGRRLVELRFIIIDTLMKKIFYTCSQSDLTHIWTSYFSHPTHQLDFDIDVECLNSISKIQLIVKKQEYPDWIDSESTVSSLRELETDNQPDSITIDMEYKHKTFFKHSSVSEIIKKYQKPNTLLRIKGFDEQGNIIKISDTAQQSILIDIVFENAEELDKIPLSEFIDKIREKINEL